MSKTKATTKGDSAKASKKDLKTKTGVKEGRVTKPAQTPKAKSKEIAKAVVAREDKKQKKSKKAPTPEPESESESDSSASESESDSDSSASSEDEKVEKKAPAKANGAAKAKAASDDDTSDSSASSEDDSEDDSESESEEEAAPKAAPKANGVKLNGAAKPAAKAAKSESESDSDSDSDSSESESEDEKPAAKAEASSNDDSASDDSDDSESDSGSSDSDESESEKEEAPSKKRKADAEPEEGVKKSKTEAEDAGDEGTKNLFVGNLSWNIDEEWLQREFESFGEITGVRIITDRETGRAKGFGYVEFATSAAAKKAQAEMHQYELDGRPLNVDFSTPRQNNNPRDKANDRANKFGDKRSPPSNTLFIGGVSFNSTNDSIGEVFGEYGTINRVSLPTDRDTGNPKGFGYVEFGTVEEATAALEALNGSDVDGRTIRVDFAGARDNNAGGRGGGFGGRGGRGGGRGGFGDRGGRGGGRGGFGGRGGGRGGRGGSTNRGGFGDFKGQKVTF